MQSMTSSLDETEGGVYPKKESRAELTSKTMADWEVQSSSSCGGGFYVSTMRFPAVLS